MNAETVVELDGIARSFGRVAALTGFSLRVDRGRVAVLLGPNGAGKTTAVRVITGALRPDTGTVRVFGADPMRDGEAIRKRVGVVPAQPAVYGRLTGRDNLRYAADLNGLGADAPIEASAAHFGIADVLDLPVGGYSTGMKARLALARAVLHDPELLLLDEPTAGLDPESARAVLDLIGWWARAGKTIIMCTHLLHEAEGIADHVVIMDSGAALLSGAPGELARRYWPPTVMLDAEDRDALEVVAKAEGVVGFERNGYAVVRLDDLARVPDLVARLTRKGVRLTRVEPRSATLEDLYFAVRREARGEAPR